MTRPLKTPADFQRVLQKNVQIAFVEPLADGAAGQAAGRPATATATATATEGGADRIAVKEVKGRLLAVSDKEVRIVPRDNKGRESAEIAVPFSAMRHAQREISFR